MPVEEFFDRFIRERKSVLSELERYPVEKLARIIRDVGFSCTNCARCCTREFNGHVFLLDRDIGPVRDADPSCLIPAPGFEFCDQHGHFYVSGYALSVQPGGNCVFLSGGRCRIYPVRPSICRVYPYMLHREPDEQGKIGWRQISGLNGHGLYNVPISPDGADASASLTKDYEIGFLEQEIGFLELCRLHFSRDGLRHVRKVYDDHMRRFHRGEEIPVSVYRKGGFDEVWARPSDYC